MSEINVSIIKNENADYGPNLVGYSTVTGDLNVSGSIRAGAGLTVTGITTFSDNITFDGGITANGNVSVPSGNVSVGDSITLYSATGVVTAAKFHGDGSELVNLPSSAGLGTALSEDTTSPLNYIYYTDTVLSVGSTVTVNPPDSSKIAYTQYSQVALTGDADLIVAAGDDFIPDILGIGTTGVGSGTLAGDGGRIRADNLTNRAGTGAPTAGNGLVVTGVATATTFDGNITGTTATFTGNVTIGGTLTYEDVTNVDSVGLVTARSGVRVTTGGVRVTTGGLEVSAGGAAITGVVTSTSFEQSDGAKLATTGKAIAMAMVFG